MVKPLHVEDRKERQPLNLLFWAETTGALEPFLNKYPSELFGLIFLHILSR